MDPSSPAAERDSCGIGFVADVRGRRSHRVLAMALEAVGNLGHRGAVSADGKSGDGTGVLTQLPERFLGRFLEDRGLVPPAAGDLALGVFFVPAGGDEVACRALITSELSRGSLEPIVWRRVPTRPEVLGEVARRGCPRIRQVLIRRPQDLDAEAFERLLFLVRRRIEHRRGEAGCAGLYVVSLSHRTAVYKGMCLAADLAAFYPDLRDGAYETSLALFHQRFSTNTEPSWALAQPFRLLAHNGEINTIQGNANWMAARQRELESPLWGERIAELMPVLEEGGSDSAMLDNALEFLARCGRDPLHAMMTLIPEAPRTGRGSELDAFYDYHATVMEPWDGPAAVVFSDGRVAAAVLDRNGLRPQRFWVTGDDLVIVGSETGIVDLSEKRVVRKGRLGPGEILAVDTESRQLLLSDEIKQVYARQQPYGEWVQRHLIEPPAIPSASPPPEDDEAALSTEQAVFGYSRDACERILDPMLEGRQPVGSMGDDTPPSVLSRQPQLLYGYFKQRFAQVTNPPIDSLREKAAFSLETMAGPWGSILGERPREGARLARLRSPVLRREQLDWLLALDAPDFRACTCAALFTAADGADGLRAGVEELCREVERAVDGGCTLIVLSDRGSDRLRAPIPMLLATATVHHHLIRRRQRMQVSLICDTGEPREDHHFACLIGYGATLIHPYLALRSVAHRARRRGLPAGEAIDSYLRVLEAGLRKIMAKLGVCPSASYQGAQLFEALGLDRDLVDRCFTGTPSRVGGVGWRAITSDALAFHDEAWPPPEDSADRPAGTRLPERGYFRFRKGGEHHALNPQVFKALRKAARSGSREAFRDFAARGDEGPPASLRGLLEWRRGDRRLALEEVEPAADIVRTFATAAMSLGALSREAHEALAVAMNRLGGRSNSGEGGESPERFAPYSEERRPEMLGRWQPAPGDLAASAIKQIASGRFGVTAHYLISAREIEIKMAQGSKPGEGGQIPGSKVTVEIAALRRSVPGVTLISPPPHHDIYSIEDLAQLIYDLKRVNPEARVGVKLVSVAGVGTIAVGVAKAYADAIHISGDCGGTGASPLSSIKHAGMPWELGLAEAQQALVAAGLRGRVVLKVDGGLKTGRDVVVATLLGAEEYCFGTAPLIALGCVMARQCHLNTCPVGIATQRGDLRRKFTGDPEHVVSYLLGVAEQVREILAEMGFASLREIVGRVDLLRPEAHPEGPAGRLDLSCLLRDADPEGGRPRRFLGERNRRPETADCLDQWVWEECRPVVRGGGTLRRTYAVRNRDRSVGARLSGEIARATGGRGLAPGSLELSFRGVAGQSFGAFLARGVSLRLTGEAQDYVGKGMSGGEIVLRPPPHLAGRSHHQVIAGNTLLYGATGGALFAAGRVGERFCVRNSGARAVVEGCGTHGCEYMTGGVAVMLGAVGENFGAGMSGGVAFVEDPAGQLEERLNPGMVGIQPLATADGELLHRLISRHAELTGSAHAATLLADWQQTLVCFRKVAPEAAAEQPREASAVVAEEPAGESVSG